jgi:uncharacterized protein YuzE
MKIKYFEDTDTALLELGAGTPNETRELSEDITLDLVDSAQAVSITVEHSSFWRSYFGSEDKVPSPDWHGEVLSERLAKVEAGEGKFLSIPELKARLAAVCAEAK